MVHIGSNPPPEYRIVYADRRHDAIKYATTIWGMPYIGSLGFNGHGFVETPIRPSDVGLGPTWWTHFYRTGWQEREAKTTQEDTIVLISGFFLSEKLSAVVSEVYIEANGKRTPVYNVERLDALPKLVKVVLPWGQKEADPKDQVRFDDCTREVHLPQPLIVPPQSPFQTLVRTRRPGEGMFGLMGSAFKRKDASYRRD